MIKLLSVPDVIPYKVMVRLAAVTRFTPEITGAHGGVAQNACVFASVDYTFQSGSGA